MTVIRVKGFQIFMDRHGKRRVYHRRTRTPVNLSKAPFGSAEFFAECARIAELVKLPLRPKPGTLGLLVREYKQDRAFIDLARRTRDDYGKIMDYLRPIESTPLARFDRPLVVRIRDQAAGRARRFGNYTKAFLSLVFSWGIERGYLLINPVTGVKNIRRPRGTPDANRLWTDAERHSVLDGAPAHMQPAIAVMMSPGSARRTRCGSRARSTKKTRSLRAARKQASRFIGRRQLVAKNNRGGASA